MRVARRPLPGVVALSIVLACVVPGAAQAGGGRVDDDPGDTYQTAGPLAVEDYLVRIGMSGATQAAGDPIPNCGPSPSGGVVWYAMDLEQGQEVNLQAIPVPSAPDGQQPSIAVFSRTFNPISGSTITTEHRCYSDSNEARYVHGTFVAPATGPYRIALTQGGAGTPSDLVLRTFGQRVPHDRFERASPTTEPPHLIRPQREPPHGSTCGDDDRATPVLRAGRPASNDLDPHEGHRGLHL